jgi:hypothetical protein
MQIAAKGKPRNRYTISFHANNKISPFFLLRSGIKVDIKRKTKPNARKITAKSINQLIGKKALTINNRIPIRMKNNPSNVPSLKTSISLYFDGISIVIFLFLSL